MGAKTTKVRLVCPAHNLSDEFTIEHANRLLRMQNNGGWQLPKDSDFKFTNSNGIEHRRNKKADNGAEEKGND
jgi:hypothetical protein|nr:MAG TPA: hypothetical protein [Caudoviricetes sp.]